MKTKFNVIFDFDGTLVDSFSFAMEKLDLLASEFNFRKIKQSEWGELKHLTSAQVIKFLNIPLLKIPFVLRRAREYVRNEISTLSTFPDLPEVLSELHQSGYILGILTSNSSENVMSWLKIQQMRHLFTFIHAESSYFGKKHLLRKIIKSHNMQPLNTFYIGDETRDVEAAKKIKIKSIGVAWGFNSVQALTHSGADYIAKTPKEILTILQQMNHAVGLM